MSPDLFVDAPMGEVTALLASRCDGCGRAEFPRRGTCPACRLATQPIVLTGPALLRVSSAVLAQPPGSRVEAPYYVGVAEFREGLCVIGLLDGDLRRGSTVDVVVLEPFDGGRIFGFREAADPAG